MGFYEHIVRGHLLARKKDEARRCQVQAISYQLSAISYQLAAFGFPLFDIGFAES
jgi:hypothetical protein